MNSKATKRALFSSAVALVICFSMLLGTTYAWFTDTVTSANNRIVSGTLEIDLLMDTGAGYTSIAEGSGNIFDIGTTANNSNKTLWEPGKTQVAYLAIENKGSLDIKYQVNLNTYLPAGQTVDMSKAMLYSITPDAEYGEVTAWNPAAAQEVHLGMNAGIVTNVALEAGTTHYFALSIHMKEEAGNEYQDKEIDFDLTVLASQLASEEDSFDHLYDELATYPNGIYVVKPSEGLITEGTDAGDGLKYFEKENAEGTFKVSGYAEDVVNVTYKVLPTVAGGIELAEGTDAVTYDIDVDGHHEDHPVKVEIFAGLGLIDVKVYHYDQLMPADSYSYDSVTGFVTFETDNFSPYTITFFQAPLADVADTGKMTVNARINSFGGTAEPIELDTSYQFKPTTSYEDAVNATYGKWHADFVVYADKDVDEGSMALAGYYEAFCELINYDWIALTNDGFEVKAGEEIRLVYSMGGITLNYEEICFYGNDGVGFCCGAADLDGSNAGTTLTVELRLYETEKPSPENGNSANVETGKYIVAGSYSYTF